MDLPYLSAYLACTLSSHPMMDASSKQINSMLMVMELETLKEAFLLAVAANEMSQDQHVLRANTVLYVFERVGTLSFRAEYHPLHKSDSKVSCVPGRSYSRLEGAMTSRLVLVRLLKAIKLAELDAEAFAEQGSKILPRAWKAIALLRLFEYGLSQQACSSEYQSVACNICGTKLCSDSRCLHWQEDVECIRRGFHPREPLSGFRKQARLDLEM